MKCPKCGKDLGEGLLPARCPSCGANLSPDVGHRNGARMAAASRASVEGLSGVGRGRRDRSFTAKQVARLVIGFAVVAAFVGIVYVIAFQMEFIGGKTVPDVVGWRSERAVKEVESAGFEAETNEIDSTAQPEGMVVAAHPGAGTRADAGSTVTLDVAK